MTDTYERVYEHMMNVASVSMSEAAETAAAHLKVLNMIMAATADSDAEYTHKLGVMFTRLKRDGLRARKHYGDSK